LCLNPEEQALRSHLKLILSTGRYTSDSTRGKHTIEALKLNSGILPHGRCRAYNALKLRIEAFMKHKKEGNEAEAQTQLEFIQAEAFQNVFEELYLLFREEDIGLNPELVDAFQSYPELRPIDLKDELVSLFTGA
jgi:hypothetical protein